VIEVLVLDKKLSGMGEVSWYFSKYLSEHECSWFCRKVIFECNKYWNAWGEYRFTRIIKTVYFTRNNFVKGRRAKSKIRCLTCKFLEKLVDGKNGG
jgi:hypothetical protein